MQSLGRLFSGCLCAAGSVGFRNNCNDLMCRRIICVFSAKSENMSVCYSDRLPFLSGYCVCKVQRHLIVPVAWFQNHCTRPRSLQLFRPTSRIFCSYLRDVGRDSAVGIAARYGFDVPGIESWWRPRFSAAVKTGPGNHPASYTMRTGFFPGL